jgi:predicted  nucleic acid-binding Zn-ribbon protein|tara:strand:- start:6582 stop:7280 length:699 start_codon:yes stop_codon:yes gene_type:complete
MSIKNLVELQKIDSQLEDLNSLLGDLPKMVEELNEQESKLINKIDENKNRLKENNLNSNKSETANSEIQGKIDKLTDQLFLVTNNKQYDALTNEIGHLKEQKNENESSLLSYLEEKDILEKEISEDEKILEELKIDLDSRRKKLEAALSETAEEKEALDKSRQKQIVKIEPSDLEIYRKVILARSGLAVVSLSGDSCSGCGAALPIQMASEIRAGNAHRCDNCGRFVYSKKN